MFDELRIQFDLTFFINEKKRIDFIQMMLEHSENDEREESEHLKSDIKHAKNTLTEEEILGHAITFFSAGTDTTSTAMSWLSWNLAMNQDIQDKLIEEIDSVLEKHVKEKRY